jgi:hypothetical protein
MVRRMFLVIAAAAADAELPVVMMRIGKCRTLMMVAIGMMRRWRTRRRESGCRPKGRRHGNRPRNQHCK